MWHGKKEKKNNTKYSGHFFPLQRPRAAHALRSDQKSVQTRRRSFSNFLGTETDRMGRFWFKMSYTFDHKRRGFGVICSRRKMRKVIKGQMIKETIGLNRKDMEK